MTEPHTSDMIDPRLGRTGQLAGVRQAAALMIVCALLILTTSARPLIADVVKRKNIDNLTATELAAFEHAIQILKDRSAANPYDKSGFLWQAWVHNCPATWVPKDGLPDGRAQCDFWEGDTTTPPSASREYELQFPGWCEHGKDLFLTWHRAQFYYFEKILQEADPNGTVTDSKGNTGPSTKDVAVPFWNWTRPPSGNRYPTAMEQTDSPLYHANRNHDPVAPGEFPFTSPLLIGHMIHYLDWPTFGGYEKAQEGGFGQFERVSHNPMHSLYFGGDMARPNTAALDPGFFPFHAYIDLLLQQWIERHDAGMITSTNAYLRATQPDAVPRPVGYVPSAPGSTPEMGQVKLYFDTQALGYEYEVLPEDEPMAQDMVARLLGFGTVRNAVFGSSPKSLTTRLLAGGRFSRVTSPDFVQTLLLKIPDTVPDPAGGAYRAVFKRAPNQPDVSYQMDVYLYPPDAPFDPAGEAFSAKYLAGIGSYWGSGNTQGHHHASGGSTSQTFAINVTNAVVDLASTGRGGEIWRMSIAISILPVGETFGEAVVVIPGQ